MVQEPWGQKTTPCPGEARSTRQWYSAYKPAENAVGCQLGMLMDAGRLRGCILPTTTHTGLDVVLE